jgi:hypothetical protein
MVGVVSVSPRRALSNIENIVEANGVPFPSANKSPAANAPPKGVLGSVIRRLSGSGRAERAPPERAEDPAFASEFFVETPRSLFKRKVPKSASSRNSQPSSRPKPVSPTVEIFGVKGVLGAARGPTPPSATAFGEAGVVQAERGPTPDAHKHEGRLARAQLDAFLAAHPDAVQIGGGKVRCETTGHEMRLELGTVLGHWQGKKYAKAFAKAHPTAPTAADRAAADRAAADPAAIPRAATGAKTKRLVTTLDESMLQEAWTMADVARIDDARMANIFAGAGAAPPRKRLDPSSVEIVHADNGSGAPQLLPRAVALSKASKAKGMRRDTTGVPKRPAPPPRGSSAPLDALPAQIASGPPATPGGVATPAEAGSKRSTRSMARAATPPAKQRVEAIEASGGEWSRRAARLRAEPEAQPCPQLYGLVEPPAPPPLDSPPAFSPAAEWVARAERMVAEAEKEEGATEETAPFEEPSKPSPAPTPSRAAEPPATVDISKMKVSPSSRRARAQLAPSSRPARAQLARVSRLSF